MKRYPTAGFFLVSAIIWIIVWVVLGYSQDQEVSWPAIGGGLTGIVIAYLLFGLWKHFFKR